MRLFSKILAPCLFLFAPAIAWSQADNSPLLTHLKNYQQDYPSEQVYLRFDKPAYTSGDTAWFKAYVLEDRLHWPSSKSAKLYVEFINDSNRVVKRMVVPILTGTGTADIVFEPELIAEGTYTVRAYTNWMQNFGTDGFFSRKLVVGEKKVRKQDVRRPDVEKAVGRLDGDPVVGPGLSLRFDLQFMPEGGSLVEGMVNKIGFKAIGENGLGVDLSGDIVDSKGNKVASFVSFHKGMGSFYLLPLAGESYKAVIQTSATTVKRFSLPGAASKGIVLHINNPRESDSVFVSVKCSPGMVIPEKSYSLTGMSGGAVNYASSFSLEKGQAVMKVAKSLFPSGIAHFTLFGPAQDPLNERLTFIDHHDQLKLSIDPGKTSYTPLDSIPLAIHVTDEKGNPVKGTFSLAVTDDKQVVIGNSGDNIVSRFLLSSGLKGNIEEPGWYFQPGNDDADKALEDLLLTQGWVGYDWKAIFSPPVTPPYFSEPDFGVRGKLSTLFNKPADNRNVRLMSPKDLLFLDTISNKQGEFAFHDLPVKDTAAYFIQVKTAKDKAAAVGIDVQEFRPAALQPYKKADKNASPAFADSAFLRKKPVSLPITEPSDEKLSPANTRKLGEIKLSTRRMTMDSVDGITRKADIIIAQAELEKEGQKSLLDLIEERVSGFGSRPSPVDPARNLFYYVNTQIIQDIIVDGRGINEFFTGYLPIELYVNPPLVEVDPNRRDEFYKYIKGILSYIRASDVTNITMYHKFITIPYYISEVTRTGDIKRKMVGYTSLGIETMVVTTRSGGGPFIPKSPGIYVYRPPVVSLPRQFYVPKYSVKTGDISDFRSTLHWEPNLITDKNGNASLLFYAGSGEGTYTVQLEGTDLNGGLGVYSSKIKIVR